MRRIAVLGAGRVGYAIIHDLSTKYHIVACDIDDQALEDLKDIKNIKKHKVDLQNTDFEQLLKDVDLVISAVPGFIGFNILKKIIQAQKNVVDISFFPEDPFELDELAKSKGICAVVDCGVAPGMGNIILGRYNEIMKIRAYECLVGGLPVERNWPYQYKAGFSPIDVIEEYIRPARYVKHGEMVTKEALSEPELVQFENVGTLESFNTDGLRTLIKTMDIPDMIEKTLRYPGTIEYLQVLRESGFFSHDPVDIHGCMIKPVDMTSKLLFPLWKLKRGEADITVMRIVIKGDLDGSFTEVSYQLHDQHDPDNQISSMARTTGYTCTAVANLIIDEAFYAEGIIAPEFVGKDQKSFEYILNYLDQRGVRYKMNTRMISGNL